MENSGSRWQRETFDLLREMDELWYHLLKSNDYGKLKYLTIFNIDFLMACVRYCSISFLRSIIELVKCKVSDWDIEFFYCMTKHSISIVSQNWDQLAVEILLWLRSFKTIAVNSSNTPSGSNKTNSQKELKKLSTLSSEDEKNYDMIKGDHLSNLVNQTDRWCAQYNSTLLIPINHWLQLSMPLQMSVITCPKPITRAILTADYQYLIFCQSKYLHLFNLSEKTIVKTVEGESLSFLFNNIIYSYPRS